MKMIRKNAICIIGLALVCSPASAQSEDIDAREPREIAYKGATESNDYNTTVDAYYDDVVKKIVGGKEAADNAFPWQVTLQVSWIADDTKAHFCGGSIYNNRWIVTAAHCTIGLWPTEVVVGYGSNLLDSKMKKVNVRKIFNHPEYREEYDEFGKGSLHNDVALIELKEPLEFDDSAQPIGLISNQEERSLTNRSMMSVTGWGATQVGGSNVKNLRYVDVNFVPLNVCKGPLSYGSRVQDYMICAGSPEKDACQGDSGGPLTFSVNGANRLAGVVSWGDGCAEPLKYGVYARVTKFIDWIVGKAGPSGNTEAP